MNFNLMSSKTLELAIILLKFSEIVILFEILNIKIQLYQFRGESAQILQRCSSSVDFFYYYFFLFCVQLCTDYRWILRLEKIPNIIIISCDFPICFEPLIGMQIFQNIDLPLWYAFYNLIYSYELYISIVIFIWNR